MTNAELNKELVAELNKKTPNQARIAELNAALDAMAQAVEARGVMSLEATLGKAEPMANCKTVAIEVKRSAYLAMERDSIIGDKDVQARADEAMAAHFAGTLSDDEYRYYASRQADHTMLHAG